MTSSRLACARLYTAPGDWSTGLTLPVQRDLHWNDELEGEERLSSKRAESHLRAGGALQAFVFNGDADCIRHFLILLLLGPRLAALSRFT